MEVRNILKLAYYEIMHILRDPILFAVVFVAPIGYALLLGSAYYYAVLEDIPVAIVDMDHSELSRDIGEAFANSHYFRIVEGIDNYDEMEKAMQDGTVRTGIVIPEDLQQDVLSSRQGEVLTVYDGSNLIWGFNIRKRALEVIGDFSARNTASYLVGQGFTPHEIQNIMNTVDYNICTWYNPTYNYSNFLFMGLMMMVIHQVGLLAVGLTVTREKERQTWFQYLSAAMSGPQIVLGKCLPYLISNFFNYTLLLWVSAVLINVKIEGSILTIILLGLLYDIIITFAGFFISVWASNSLQVTRCLMLMSVPFFFLSGYTWLWMHMPAPVSALGKILPYSWMAQGFRMATMKNLALTDMAAVFLVMTVMAVLAVLLALSFDKRTVPLKDPGVMVNSGSTYPRKRFFTLGSGFRS